MSIRYRCPSIAAVALVGLYLALSPPDASAQSADTAALTTKSPLYTAAQAEKGKELHGLACLSCHKPAEQTGTKFWELLVGKSVGEFFGYVRSSMPQDNPASLSDSDYASIIAYIFSLNAVPAGEVPLPGDSTALARIRVVPVDTIATTRKGPGK